MNSAHRPNFILQVLSEMIGESCILTPERFRMDENLTFFADALGACERILKTPIPLSYTRWVLACCVDTHVCEMGVHVWMWT